MSASRARASGSEAWSAGTSTPRSATYASAGEFVENGDLRFLAAGSPERLEAGARRADLHGAGPRHRAFGEPRHRRAEGHAEGSPRRDRGGPGPSCRTTRTTCRGWRSAGAEAVFRDSEGLSRVSGASRRHRRPPVRPSSRDERPPVRTRARVAAPWSLAPGRSPPAPIRPPRRIPASAARSCPTP